MLEHATGAGYTLEECLRVGERVWNLERLFNLKAGLSGKDDTLPPRILHDGIPEGPAKGMVRKPRDVAGTLPAGSGWDAKGVPSRKKLRTGHWRQGPVALAATGRGPWQEPRKRHQRKSSGPMRRACRAGKLIRSVDLGVRGHGPVRLVKRAPLYSRVGLTHFLDGTVKPAGMCTADRSTSNG
jgi:hypothetical protein